MVTSLLASLGLRAVVHNWRGDPGEISRLEREEALSKNLVVTTSRLLIPSRGGPGSVAASQVLHFAWPEETGVTILTVDPVPGQRGITRHLRPGSRRTLSQAAADPANQNLKDADITPLQNVFHEREVEHRIVKRPDIVDAIASESQLGFGAIGISLELSQNDANGDATPVLTPLVEELLAISPLPVIMVRRPAEGLPAAFSRALVPVSAAPTSRMACEVAFNISAKLGTQVQLAHVLADETAGFSLANWRRGARRRQEGARSEPGQDVLDKTQEMATELGLEVSTAIQTNSSRAAGILELAQQNETDLIVMGAQLRRVNNRPYLGSTVEQVLQESSATVVLVLAPFDL